MLIAPSMPLDLSFFRSTRYQVTICLVMAVFFTLFLLFFLPFGVSNHNPNHRYNGEFVGVVSLFGISTLVTSLLSEFVLARRLPLPGGWLAVVVWWAWTGVSIGTANFLLYNFVGDWHDLHWRSAAGFIFNCSSVIILPLVGCFLYFRHEALRERFQTELQRERGAVDPDRMLTFSGSGSADHLVLRLRDFLHARAQDNYVELHYLAGGESRSHLLRATLAGLSETTADTGIVRCHRSYLINLRRVVAVRGSGANLQLLLDAEGEPVPVSRSYAEQTLAALRALGLAPAIDAG